MNDTVIAETFAEARALARRWQFWLVLIAAGFVVGLTGPFGTYETLPAIPRVAYWLVVVSTTFWLGYLVSFAVTSVCENRGTGALLSLGGGAVVAGFALTVWLASFHVVIFADVFWVEALRLFPYVVLITVVMAIVSETREFGDVKPAEAASLPVSPAWLDQLPNHLGRDLVLLRAEDHYVRAQTKLGETLIRASLQDAVKELGSYGVRTHRSWWVARDAIQSYQYRKGSPVLVLQNGLTVPVGRTYRRSVKDTLS